MVDASGLKPQTNKRTIKNTTAAVEKPALPVGEITPADLKNWNGELLYIKNNTHNLLSFDDPVTKIAFTLGGKATGEHITTIPVEAARNSGLQRTWRRGDVTISTDPDLEDELYEADEAALEHAKQDQAKKAPGEVTVTNEADRVVYKGRADDHEPSWRAGAQ